MIIFDGDVDKALLAAAAACENASAVVDVALAAIVKPPNSTTTLLSGIVARLKEHAVALKSDVLWRPQIRRVQEETDIIVAACKREADCVSQ